MAVGKNPKFLQGSDTDRPGVESLRPVARERMDILLGGGRLPDPPSGRAESFRRTLLLVDDEANILNSLTRLRRRDGYLILRAGSGEAGLGLLATHEVGVIVSDQRMPGMSGVDF